MKKILEILFLAAIFFTIGCTSTPSIEKLSSDECLIVIRSGTNKENAGARTGRDYYFHVTEIDHTFRIPNKSNQKIVFKINNDQVKIDKLTGRVSAGFEGQSLHWDTDIKLPYSPGRVIPLNYSIVNEVRQVSKNSYSANIEFYEMSKEDLNTLYTEIKNNPEYESWF